MEQRAFRRWRVRCDVCLQSMPVDADEYQGGPQMCDRCADDHYQDWRRQLELVQEGKE